MFARIICPLRFYFIKHIKFKLKNTKVVNFLPDSCVKDVHRANLQTFLVPNVVFNKSNQYAYLITMNGDVYFFKMKMSDSCPIRTFLWQRSINAIVLKCYKVDINVKSNSIDLSTKLVVMLFSSSTVERRKWRANDRHFGRTNILNKL